MPLPSWADAERCCGEAYQASSVVERYRHVSRQLSACQGPERPIGPYAMRQLAAFQHVWLALDRPNPLRVLDFGGSLGNHFHALATHWPWVPLHWTVCETAVVASAGQADLRQICLLGTSCVLAPTQARFWPRVWTWFWPVVACNTLSTGIPCSSPLLSPHG